MKQLALICVSIVSVFVLSSAQARTAKTYPEIQTKVSSSVTENPKRTIKITYPFFKSRSLTDNTLNRVANGMLSRRVRIFKQHTPQTVAGFTSALDIHYSIPFFKPGKFVSLQFKQYQYTAGAAHPNTTTFVINYDFAKARTVTFGDIFKDPIVALRDISNYSIQQLKKRNLGDDNFLNAGARPRFDNYKNWNFTPGGLLITFDPYQVAAYVYGPQVVVVPYALLRDHLQDTYLRLLNIKS